MDAPGTGQLSTKIRLRNAAAELLFRSGGLRLAQSRAKPPWRVLTYHRIIDPEKVSYPLQPGMYVRPETFRAHMRYLAKNAEVVALSQLLLAIDSGKTLGSRAVAVTLDDGWLDNYQNALPVFRETGIPAAICLATSFIGSQSVFWTDRVAQAISALRKDPEIRRSGGQRIAEDSAMSPGLKQHLQTALEEGRPLTVACDELCEKLKVCPPAERQLGEERLTALAAELSEVPQVRHFMNWDEVREMSESGVSFLSHSHRHQNMAELPEERLRDEVVESQEALRAAGLSASKALCYPGGYQNSLTQRVLYENGIEFALATSRCSLLDLKPKLIGRVSMHQDVTATVPAFAARVWVDGF